MAKTLFHSSERSNFIVNLKPERLRQLSCRVCMLAMILLTGSMWIIIISFIISKLPYTMRSSVGILYQIDNSV